MRTTAAFRSTGHAARRPVAYAGFGVVLVAGLTPFATVGAQAAPTELRIDRCQKCTFFVSSIREDNDGTLWVVSGTRRSTPARAAREGPVDYRSDDAVHEGITFAIDVIDPRRRPIIYSQTSSEHLTLFGIKDGLAYRYREDADGNPRVELISVRERVAGSAFVRGLLNPP